MTAPYGFQVSPVQNNMNDLNQAWSDIRYPILPSVQPEAPSLYPPSISEPPPYLTLVPVQQPMYPPPPVIITQTLQPYQYVMVNRRMMPSQTAYIRDYLVWSVVNVFLGGFLLGFIAIILSMQTMKRKMEGNVIAARNMSKTTLIFNIIITTLFFVLTGFLIVHYVYFMSTGDKSYR